jgi:hypothetical protein
MQRNKSVLTFLKHFRYPILALMAIASLVNAFVRFSGDWSHFWSVLAAHAWFTQAVFAYLRGGWVAIGPGGLSKDANPLGRAALAATAFAFYLLTFTYEIDNHADSIHKPRASDWTMPTRAVLGERTQ